jgi:hypothetical protein
VKETTQTHESEVKEVPKTHDSGVKEPPKPHESEVKEAPKTHDSEIKEDSKGDESEHGSLSPVESISTAISDSSEYLPEDSGIECAEVTITAESITFLYCCLSVEFYLLYLFRSNQPYPEAPPPYAEKA